MKLDKKRKYLLVTSIVIGGICVLYLIGLTGQIISGYSEWTAMGATGTKTIRPIDWNPIVCFGYAFSLPGLKALMVIGVSVILIFAFRKISSRSERDPRGFNKSKIGLYGTASFMNAEELNKILKVSMAGEAEGTILGALNQQIVSVPFDTRLNRHTAVFGASGTGKSRSIIRNALLQAFKNGESVIVTDPKGELYSDTAELYRNHGYDVKVFNLVNPDKSDCWNCMSEINGDSLMTQILTNVIIGNTSSGKGDRFWDSSEGNLLKALIFFVDGDKSRTASQKNLGAVYNIITRCSMQELCEAFYSLDIASPARAAFNLFMQASETVRSGVFTGLGTRLQILQNESVRKLVSKSDIDLTGAGKRKSAYYIILSDQESTMAFLSSLFFSFLFIKLLRYADSEPNGRCAVPVNLILDEFNNVGRLGGAEDGSDFARTLSVCRSRDIRVMLAVQSLGQLQNRYANNLWAEIVGNCDIQLMLGSSDDITAEYFSNRSGDMSVDVESIITERKTFAIAQVIPEYRRNEGKGKRKVLTVDEVLRLPNEDLLCVIRGCNILKLKKWDYTNHPLARLMVRTTLSTYVTKEDMTEKSSEYDEKPKIKKVKVPDKIVRIPTDSI